MTENMNQKRACWAGVAVEAFEEVCRTDPEDLLPDLLCDLMHWAQTLDLDFEAELARARYHYQYEIENPGE